MNISKRFQKPLLCALLAVLTWAGTVNAATSWWDAKWPVRKKITIDTTDKGVAITDAIGTTAVLVKLHDGDFNFIKAKEDGSDLRFVAEDDKTVLKHHVEKWDSLLNEAYVWVQVPDLKPSAATSFWLYYGNVTDAVKAENAKGTYDPDTVLVYHFGDSTTMSADSSTSAIGAQDTTPPISGAPIGNGLRLLGSKPVTVPDATPLEWTAGGMMTWSAWIKATTLPANAILFSRRDGANSFLIGLDKGVPFVEINKLRSSGGTAISPAVWNHLAVVAKESTLTVYLNGSSYGTLGAALPAMKGPSLIGKDSTPDAAAFVGEIDELQIAKTARPLGFVKFAAISQGTGAEAAKLLVVGTDEDSAAEAEGELGKQASLIKDISKSLTIDGWVVIVLCGILAVVGWLVAIAKLLYLNKISKATRAFLVRWEKISSDLTALDTEDEDSIKSLGGTVNPKGQRLMRHSPLFHIYRIGTDEVNKRLQNVRAISLASTQKPSTGLSGRSIQAIKATLHGGLMREVQKLNSKLVFLTIGIAGGPYLGLLGTVIGVMITFAVIAKTGQVEVNSIAPGIAGALLATVAGLAVAIPALFAYSYLSSRIKDAITDMETFIDEFIAKMAEHHKEVN